MVTVEKYRLLYPLICEVKTTNCRKHKGSSIELYCKKHDTSFCVLCKELLHKDCDDVKSIDNELIAEVKGKVKRCVEEAMQEELLTEKVINVLDENVSKLNEVSDRFNEQLQTCRQRINEFVDTFERKTKQDMEALLQTELQEICCRKDKVTVSQHAVAKTKELLETLFDFEGLSHPTYLCLFEKLQSDLTAECVAMENLKRMDYIRCDACNLSLEINEKTLDIKINRSLKFEKEQIDIPIDHQDNIVESSCEEVENEIHCVPNHDEEYKTMGDKMFYSNYDFNTGIALTKKDLVAAIFCIATLSDHRIVLGCSCLKVILIYGKSGNKIGEVKMRFPATSLAVLDDNNVAVVAHKAVVFVNPTNFEIQSFIPLKDECTGMAKMKDKLVVNCNNKGITLVSSDGCVSPRIQSLAGQMQLCVVSKTKLAAFDQKKDKIYFFDLESKTPTMIDHNISRTYSITSDRKKSIFCALRECNKIVRINTDTFQSVEILSDKDGINNPVAVHFDTASRALFILSENGSSIYVFKSKEKQP